MADEQNTTSAEVQSAADGPLPKLWLRWVYPTLLPSVPLEHGLIIGRDTDCHVPLSGRGISRRHVEIHRQGPIFALKDLGSRNGTFLNGGQVQHAPISRGAVLRISDYVGVFVESVEPPNAFGRLAAGLLGGPELDRALMPMKRAAKTDIPVMIVGATGTGKERVARALHSLSGRTGAFHAINCAALPKDLAEAELFGHRKGAFTGAEGTNLGHFRAAHQGTLFLDEVAELPRPLQAKLLRVLEEGQVTPLGDTKAIAVDVRLVSAAQRPLQDFVVAQEFRDDLMARLAGLTVSLPPLRDRPADIAPLFEYFANLYSGERTPGVEAKLIECVCLHTWPSNVRGLEHLTRSLLATHGAEPTLRRSFLPEELRALVKDAKNLGGIASAPPPDRGTHDALRLALALKKNGGNVAQASTYLGFSRYRAYRLLGDRSIDEFVASKLGTVQADAPPNTLDFVPARELLK